MTEFKVSVKNRFLSGINLKVEQSAGGTHIITPGDKVGFFLPQGSHITVTIDTPNVQVNNCNIKLPDVADFDIMSDLNTDFYRRELGTHVLFPGETTPDWQLKISAPDAHFEYSDEYDMLGSGDPDDTEVGDNEGMED